MPWYAMDTRFCSDAKVETLGEEFGPGGPLAVVAMLAEAKLQGAEGSLEWSYRKLTAEAFLDGVAQARAIVARAAELWLLADFEALDERTFSARFPSWERWQTNFRKQKQRERECHEKPHEQADVTKKVTPVTTQDRTVQDKRESARARKRPKADHDSLPSDLPERLAPTVDQVIVVLGRIVASRGGGGVAPTRLGVGRAIASYPDRDHRAAAESLEHWLVAGTGQNQKVRDVVGYYRNQLDRSPPVAPPPETSQLGRRARDRMEDAARLGGAA